MAPTGVRIPDAEAALLAKACRLTFVASGSQTDRADLPQVRRPGAPILDDVEACEDARTGDLLRVRVVPRLIGEDRSRVGDRRRSLASRIASRNRPRTCDSWHAGMAADQASAGGRRIRGQPRGARAARRLRPPRAAPRNSRRDHPRLHRRLLGRHPLPRQPGLLPPVLDARPELQRAGAGPHLARAPRPGDQQLRLGDPHLDPPAEPCHDHDPLLRPAGGRLRLRRRLPAAHGRGAAPDRGGRGAARASVLAGGRGAALHG